LIELPDGLLALDEPYEPDIRRVYWLHPPLLDPHDPKPERPAVVVKVGPDITVVTRSSSAATGLFHPRDPANGLTRDGRFTRARTVSALLWTPRAASSLDLFLDESTFKLVCKEFGV
jgi:hypothetical protein